MARADGHRERIGDMLVAASLVTRAQLDEALAAQRSTHMPLGKQLVALGYVTELQLTQVLSNQLAVPWVSLLRIEFSAELLARVPGDIADRYTIMPVYVRNVRNQGETLYVAMDDPTDEIAIKRVSSAAGLPVKPMIASPTELRTAIEQHYFGGAPASAEAASDSGGLREVLERAAEALNESEIVTRDTPRAARLKPPPPPPTAASARQDGVVAVEQYETPSQPPPTDKSRTLTLLDGTRIALPNAGSRRISQEVTAVRHVVKAVRAASADLGLEGPVRWHDIMQAVLDALQQRGIKLSKKEIAEAWARQRQPRAPTNPSE